ncbi:teichoic acid transport system ATP-binding protein [Virgibacillus halotolerans]|uniref:teichoic acids export ABC transporter ATP-binding subunit TagH n=1 Tax=Virgibacillus halotolerans TaxID=1071053 RepID=UPI00196180F3|nr:teichoic acids export ABC transporter ATP-binding subunit TagH [Virgibacillus halotolerans]MBM7600172.1 teichoic acid transport system ATP-binding protein [Virgibacillus halotolerans]
MNHSVIFKNVTKKYKMYGNTSEKLKDLFVPDHYGEDFYALQHINFTADEGDVIGVIGVNGAGKSTLSNLITGIVPSTSGEIKIKGEAALIAIASGLNNQLSGRDNIELKCLMLGFNKKEINALMPDIIEFADIDNFIDQPVKNYSSGMKSRLGFAISVNVDPDVLVIDEALSVGDQTFADKCMDKMNEFKKKGKTIFFISHSIGQVKKFCQKVMWLEAGEIKAYGTTDDILPQYQKFLKEFNALSKEEQKNFKQLVLEKRSKLREKENLQVNEEESDEIASSNPSRIYLNKRRKYMRILKWSLTSLIIALLFLGGAIFVDNPRLLFNIEADKSEKSASDEVDPHISDNKTVTEEDKLEEREEDIRYVTVDSAYIRTEPDLDSEASSVASFGQAFVVEESERKAFEDVDWLKIIGKNTHQEGWISSQVMDVVSGEINDPELENGFDKLVESYPTLEKVFPMIGKTEDEVESFESTKYKYFNDRVVGFTITLNGSSNQLFDDLGDPQIEQADKTLYHGSAYDFIFSLDGEMINKLTIIKN